MNESPEILAELQRIIDRSRANAGPAMRKNFVHEDWVMDATEFVSFWRVPRLAAVATTSAAGVLHMAPLEVSLERGRFHLPTFRDSVRLRDHLAGGRCGISAWDDAYHAVIVYGAAAIPDDSSGALVDVTVTPTHIFAIRRPRP